MSPVGALKFICRTTAVMMILQATCLISSHSYADIFKGDTESFPVSEQNSIKVRNALLSVLVSNSAALRIHRLLTDDNVVFSPLGVSNALAMLYLGSSDQTAAEMEESLDFNSTFIHDGLLSVRQSMTEDVEECDSHALKFASALVLSSKHSVSDDYEEESSYFYSADLIRYPSTADQREVVEMVNAWVSNATRGNIESVITDLPSISESLTLANALYFKAPWQYPFDPAKTMEKSFYSFGYKAAEVPFMHRTIKCLYGYHPDVDAFVLQLPYSGMDVDALFLLPRQRSGLHKLETDMNVEVLNTLPQAMYNTEVDIAVPKVKLVSSLELPRILSNMGVQGLFAAGANLSGIDPGNSLYVSQLVHKTTFEMTESGTEASSSSRATVQTLSLKPTFYLNHPFMFILKHRWTGAILFLGRVQSL